MNDSSVDSAVEVEQPLISHLLELRTRLLHIVTAVLVVFGCLFYFSNDLYTLLAEPLLKALPAGAKMIATKPAGTFFAPMKLTLVISMFVAMPYILYQIWGFIAPGLYSHEKKLAVPLLVSSTALFYTGMAFAYFVVLRLMFRFFVGVTPAGVEVATDISEYLDFVLTIFFAFGAAFEVPIATIILVWTGITTPQALAQKRPYIIVAAFIIGAVLTPPDVISQTLLAVPMLLLFEAGVFFSHRFVRAKTEEDQPEETAAAATDSEMDRTLDRYIDEENALKGSVETPPDGK